MKKTIITVVLLGLIAPAIVWAQEVTDVDLHTLTREIDNNKARANQTYQNKTLRLTGFATNISNYNFFLSVDEYFLGIQVYFNPSEQPKLINLNKGQRITIRGIYTLLLGEPRITRAVIEDGPPLSQDFQMNGTVLVKYRGEAANVTIPAGVTSIGDSAFEGCTSLTSITIPSSVTSIGAAAFAYCWSLTGITIPSSVTSIGDQAFEGCRSLTSITIPSSVTVIEVRAFYGCSSLTSVTISSGVRTIGDYAFYECKSLASITIPSSVISIGVYAFLRCSSLSSVTIPSSVTSIGINAFAVCTSLASVTVSRKTTIGEGAFPSAARITYSD